MLRLLVAALVLPIAFDAVSVHAAPAAEITAAAEAFLHTLSAEQRQQAVLPVESPERLDWHYIPKATRKGVQFKDLTPESRAAALQLLRASTSEAGAERSQLTMKYEALIGELEGERRRQIRDPERFYIAICGTPGATGRWSWSIEGHHLSLNYVIDGNRLVSTTPQAFCVNPAVVKNENQTGVAVGTRMLEQEETLAFALMQSLSAAQRQLAIIDQAAPADVRDPGSPQPPATAAEGISYRDLSDAQRKLLLELIQVYCRPMPPAIEKQRMDALHFAGLNALHFAWAGATEPGVGHYYRIQGPTVLIEFCNVQADAAGNPVNHIHTTYRDPRGDFGVRR